MIVRHAFILVVLLSACAKATVSSEDAMSLSGPGRQAFTLGPMPISYNQKGDLRYIVSVPKRYLDKELLPKLLQVDDQNRIVANAIRFSVKYPSLEPTRDAWAKGSIRLEIGNIIETGISQSVDGTWSNYYSGYNIDLPDEYGLSVRSRRDAIPSMPDRLYFRITADRHVRIECKANLNEADKWCVMTAKRPGQPLLETGFYAVELPNWRERLDRLSTLFRAEGKKPLGNVRELSS